MPKQIKYVAGGTVQAGGGVYVPREADAELLVLCRNKAFVYILSSRQVGKSSLMINTVDQLAHEGIRSVIIDMTNFGAEENAERWYTGLLREIARQLKLRTDASAWWSARGDLPMAQRLTLFFQEVVLVEITAPIVVFVDEIDITQNLSFTDDFYGAIRYVYNARAKVPEFQRLSFVLIGVAMPKDLIRDPKRTPFNIGQRLELTDFSFEEALPLADGLNLQPAAAHKILAWVLDWTGGHPYLTLQLFKEISRELEYNGKANWTLADIDTLVANTFFGNAQDRNLQFVRDKLTESAPDRESVLITYREVLRNEKKVLDEERSPTKSHLKLAGVVRREDDALVVRNRIYREEFDEAWVKDHLPVNWPRRLTRAALISILILLAACGPLAAYAWNKKGAAETAAAKEREARQETETALKREEQAWRTAEAKRQEAEKQKEIAESARKQEQIAKQEAQQLARSETAARAEAERRRKDAEDQRRIAVEQRQRAEQLFIAERAATQRAMEAARQEQIARKEAEVERAKAVASQKAAEEAQANAEKAKQEADKLNHILRARGLAFQADGLIDTAPQTGTLLAAKSIKDYPSSQANQALHHGLRRLPRPSSKPEDSSHFEVVRAKAVALSPDGKFVAATNGNTVQVRSVVQDRGIDEATTQGEPQLRMVLNHSGPVNDVAFSPSGRFIATASADQTTRLWDMKGQEVWPSPYKAKAAVNEVIFSPDEKYIATGSDDNTAALLDITTGKVIRTFNQGAEVNAATFGLGGEVLVTGGKDGTARVWATSSSSKGWSISSGSSINAIALTPDARYVVTASADGLVRFFSDPSKEDFRLPHPSQVNAMAFSPDGRFLATACDDGKLRMWEWANQKQIAERALGHKVTDVVFNSTGQLLVVAGDDDTIRILDVTRGLSKAEPEPFTLRLGDPVQAVAFSPEREYIAVATANKTAAIWNVETLTQLQLGATDGHLEVVNSIAFSADGKYVVTGSQDGTSLVWDAKTGALKARLTGHQGPVNSVAFRNDGKFVVTASGDTTARVWDWNSEQGRANPKVLPHEGGVNSAVFDPSGQIVATASGEKDHNDISLWNVTGGEPKKLAVFPRKHTESVKAIAFNPISERKYLVSVSLDRTVRLWDWADLNNIHEVDGLRPMKHDAGVNAVAFSPDGAYIATGSNDRTARVWDLSDGREIAQVTHSANVNAVAFTGKRYGLGKYLVTGSFDRTVRFWLWRRNDLLVDACSRLTRNLTREEWEQYLENEPYQKICEALPDAPK